MTAPDFIEIGTDDPEATTAFFGAVMGWDWRETEAGGYFTDEAAEGAEHQARKVGMHREETVCMVPYLAVADIEATVARVEAAGGRLWGAISDAPGLGRFATCSDPRGVRFGLHQN